jgi:hypothetical protein
MNPQNALAKLEELQARAKEVQSKFLTDMAPIAAQIKECAESLTAVAGSNGTGATASATLPIPVKRRGRPKGIPNTPKAKLKVVGKRPGRPKGSKNKPKADASPASAPPTVTKASGEMKLEDALLHVLAHPKTWHRHVADLPKGCTGLKVMELAQIVQGEGLWKTDSKNPEQQVSQRLADLREADKVVRGDQMRYRLKD